MGYRSKVAVLLSSAAFARWAKTSNLFPSHRIVDCGDGSDRSPKLVVFDCIKWYPEFNEVSSVEGFLKEIDEEGDPELQWQFIRLGEDWDDIETFDSSLFDASKVGFSIWPTTDFELVRS